MIFYGVGRYRLWWGDCTLWPAMFLRRTNSFILSWFKRSCDGNHLPLPCVMELADWAAPEKTPIHCFFWRHAQILASSWIADCSFCKSLVFDRGMLSYWAFNAAIIPLCRSMCSWWDSPASTMSCPHSQYLGIVYGCRSNCLRIVSNVVIFVL